jgi:hypothetical protein
MVSSRRGQIALSDFFNFILTYSFSVIDVDWSLIMLENKLKSKPNTSTVFALERICKICLFFWPSNKIIPNSNQT